MPVAGRGRQVLLDGFGHPLPFVHYANIANTRNFPHPGKAEILILNSLLLSLPDYLTGMYWF